PGPRPERQILDVADQETDGDQAHARRRDDQQKNDIAAWIVALRAKACLRLVGACDYEPSEAEIAQSADVAADQHQQPRREPWLQRERRDKGERDRDAEELQRVPPSDRRQGGFDVHWSMPKGKGSPA